MSDTTGLSRRKFFSRTAVLASAGVAAPAIVPRAVLGAESQPGANERIGVAYIGCGRRGNQLLGLPAEGRVVGGADLDGRRAEAFAAKTKSRPHQDYRQVLDAGDVDAVVIATPDHWHVLPAIHACQAGKDVYLEKPLSLTIREGRLLVEAVRKHQRVLQTGSQRRSMSGHRRGCELVRNGLAGKIHTVLTANSPSPWRARFPGEPVPQGLDWDAWCGMTEPVPYHKDIFIQRSSPGWISLEPYSGGEMTGNGVHGLDQIQWALDMDHTGPVEISCEGGKLEPIVYTQPESLARGNAAMSRGHRVTMRYANGVTIRFQEGAPVAGGVFIGDKGKISVGSNQFSTSPNELAQVKPEELKVRLPVSDHHIGNWFECIKSRERPIADVEIGHRSAVLCHLGNIVRWVGRDLRWDPEKETFPGDDEANAFLDRPRRKGYELPEVI